MQCHQPGYFLNELFDIEIPASQAWQTVLCRMKYLAFAAREFVTTVDSCLDFRCHVSETIQLVSMVLKKILEKMILMMRVFKKSVII